MTEQNKDLEAFLNSLPSPPKSKLRVVLAFPITLLVMACIPIGFLLSAIKTGLSIGELKFKVFSIAMVLENRKEK